MIVTEETRAIGEAMGVPALLHKLSEFCDLNSDRISIGTTVSISLDSSVQPRVHMKSKGNAARAVMFALDTLDNVRIVVCQQDDTRQFYLRGMFDGTPMEIVACANFSETAAIDAIVDWQEADWLGDLTITPGVLREMAERES